MNYFKKWDIIVGWIAFAISATVCIATTEPTASLWDCAEFISTAFKLEVGHPPGAPLFMMIARLFAIFAPSVQTVALAINIMSCLASAFTILFLFWTITHLGRKIYARNGEELTKFQSWAVIGAGFIGSVAYTFTDTFWFSGVEGEVYALSSMFTALVVWAMLKWEDVADEPHSKRWLVLIAYFMGLSIGVHILNLLTIPALVFIYYFRKTDTITWWGIAKTTAVAFAILGVINGIIIPYSVSVGAWFDRLFVNSFGMPVNSGITFYVLAIFAILGAAIYYTHKRGHSFANFFILCVTVIMLGYTSYASVIIRASANPPMNSNNPNNPYALLSLLNRDQYGSRPLLFGPAYSSPPIEAKYKDTYYLGDNGKYEKSSVITGYEYPAEFEFFFPRMYSSNENHIKDYQGWVDVKGKKIPFQEEVITVPTFGENLQYFFTYQLNFMYWRYFLWNFVGRQSDNQSVGEITDGNWLSGIPFIDAIFLGPQDNLPSEMKANKARNTYFFLPFILGVIGLMYQLNRDKRGFSIVMWLFFMLGIALVLYFNSVPSEPRERDYVYAGSFYAFCIWIGLGVMSVADWLAKKFKVQHVCIAGTAIAICASVPVVLAVQNWDDHDRSHRYTVRDIGWNYLQSTLPNAIVMNYGDNDTFPLWYNQEVEGVREDVRIMNMSYLGGDWYIDEMKTKVNDSEAVPFSLPRNKYVNNNDYVYLQDAFGKPLNIKTAMDFFNSDDPRTKANMGVREVDYIPAKTLLVPVNKENAIASGIVKAEDAHLMVDTLVLEIKKSAVDKSELMLLDLLANFDWKRPLYFTQVYTLSALGLKDYLQFDGYSYRLVPIKTPYTNALSTGRIDTEYLYDKLMKVNRYGNVEDERVYADYFVQNNQSAAQTRNAFARLAKDLVAKGDTVRAIEVLDYGIKRIPFSQIRHSYAQTFPVIEAYYIAGARDKAGAIMDEYSANLREYITYFGTFKGRHAELVANTYNEKVQLLAELYNMSLDFNDMERAQEIKKFFDSIGIK